MDKIEQNKLIARIKENVEKGIYPIKDWNTFVEKALITFLRVHNKKSELPLERILDEDVLLLLNKEQPKKETGNKFFNAPTPEETLARLKAEGNQLNREAIKELFVPILRITLITYLEDEKKKE